MIENTNDYYLSFDELLYNAEQERLTFTQDKMGSFGIEILDKYTLGIFPHDLVVIGADSGVGKTELAYKCAVENAKKGKKVLFFALEGNINDIARRYTQQEINKCGVKVKTSEFRVNKKEEHHDFAKTIYTEVSEQSWASNLQIFNKKNVATIDFMVELIQKSKDYFDMFIIDHLHYIQYSDNSTENDQISKAMRTLQTLTGEMKKPIVLIGHLRKRKLDTDPTKYDLHGSSNIPKEASTVVLLTRMDLNDNEKRCDNIDILGDKPEYHRYAGTKIIIDKSRAGMPTPTKLSLIYDLQKKDYIPEYSCLIKKESKATEADLSF